MATFDELTQAQRVTISDYQVMLRSVSGELARVMNHMAALNTAWNAQVSATVALLTNGALTTDASGLAGAAQLSKEEVTNITSYCQGILTSYNTAAHREVISKACGAGNLIG